MRKELLQLLLEQATGSPPQEKVAWDMVMQVIDAHQVLLKELTTSMLYLHKQQQANTPQEQSEPEVYHEPEPRTMEGPQRPNTRAVYLRKRPRQ